MESASIAAGSEGLDLGRRSLKTLALGQLSDLARLWARYIPCEE